MTAPKALTRAELALQKHALTYPESTEDFPWDHRSAKVRGKLFLILSIYEGKLGVTVKLPVSGTAALSLPFAEPTGYGLGKSGWVSARFAATDAIPIDMLKEWIDESYRAVAPKKLVALLENAEVAPPKKPLTKRSSK